MLFLVKGKVTYHPYMGDRRKPTDELRLVDAESIEEAERKFDMYFVGKSIENDDGYSTSDVEAFAPIL